MFDGLTLSGSDNLQLFFFQPQEETAVEPDWFLCGLKP